VKNQNDSEEKEGSARTIELPPDPADESSESSFSAHLQSILIQIELENTTARTQLNDSSKIKVIQILEKGLVLEVPDKICAAGHNLGLKFNCKGSDGTPLTFQATGKVESVTHFPDHSDQVKIKLVQYLEPPWEALLKMLQERQKQITQFLADAGGE